MMSYSKIRLSTAQCKPTLANIEHEIRINMRLRKKIFDLYFIHSNSSMRTMLLLWQSPHLLLETSAAPSLMHACAGFNTTISLSNTMVLSQGCSSPPQISINGPVLQSVEKFCYLGSTVENTNSLKWELDILTGRAATTFGQLRPRVWSNGNLSIRVKIQVPDLCCQYASLWL